MKKLSYILGVSALLLTGMTSCNPDKDPKIDTSTEFNFKLNTPQLATQFIDLSTNGNLQFTVSQPDYGVTVVPTYGLEISLTEDFKPITDEPVVDEEGVEHIVPGVYNVILDSQLKGVLVAPMATIAAGINELNGVYDESSYTGDYVGPLYVRATARLGSGHAAEVTSTVSNTVKLSQVQGFASFGKEAFVLYVPGSYGGWSDIEPQLTLSEKYTTDDTMVIFGFSVIDGTFKINDGNWDGPVNWGVKNGDDSIGFLPFVNDAGDEVEGTYVVDLYNNGGDLNGDGVVPAGLYFFYLTITDYENDSSSGTEKVGSLKITKINSVTLPGDYNGWDAAGNAMTQESDLYTWTGQANVTSGGWKFAMNDSWEINLGGSPEELIYDEGNLTLEGSSVTLDLSCYPWNCTVH